MKTTVIPALGASILILANTLPANAITRIRADQNTCATVQQTIANQGAAVVRYPSTRVANYILYDRYVSPYSSCPLGQEIVSETVPARDNPKCVVYKCERIEPIFPWDD